MVENQWNKSESLYQEYRDLLKNSSMNSVYFSDDWTTKEKFALVIENEQPNFIHFSKHIYKLVKQLLQQLFGFGVWVLDINCGKKKLSIIKE